jgi:hypothetical protein
LKQFALKDWHYLIVHFVIFLSVLQIEGSGHRFTQAQRLYGMRRVLKLQKLRSRLALSNHHLER